MAWFNASTGVLLWQVAPSTLISKSLGNEFIGNNSITFNIVHQTMLEFQAKPSLIPLS